MKVIIDVHEYMAGSNRYVFTSNGRSYLFYKDEVQPIDEFISKLEADKAELIETLKAIKESLDDSCISDAQMIVNAIIQKMEK